MSKDSSSVQRSYRFSRRTIELLDEAAELAGESRNALAERLLSEAVHVQHHPLVRFHHGAAGRRQALVVGTRLYVHQVMSTLRACDNNLDAAAEYLSIAPRQVRAALEYYAEFADDIDQDAAVAQRLATDERARWDRQQRLLA